VTEAQVNVARITLLQEWEQLVTTPSAAEARGVKGTFSIERDDAAVQHFGVGDNHSGVALYTTPAATAVFSSTCA
jgi:hypothetical protein